LNCFLAGNSVLSTLSIQCFNPLLHLTPWSFIGNIPLAGSHIFGLVYLTARTYWCIYITKIGT